MKITRRGFLKVSGTATGALLMSQLGPFKLGPDKVAARQGLKTEQGESKTTICPYCAVGCGLIVTSVNGMVINVEGDQDHPINQGSICSKASALYQVVNNKLRLKKVMYRAPGSSRWEYKSWDWVLDRLAERIKKTRDASFKQTERGLVVNRTEAIAGLGGSALNNEECYLWSKLARALGIVYLEHQARICHSSTVAALDETFGRGAMTNHWIDIKNSDCILVIGSNVAEQHPVAFKWINEARNQRGAKLISLDPRFTRTSASADIYAPFRSGSDIALIGGIINYCLQNEMYHKEYVEKYTNASFLIDPAFGFQEGVFAGYKTVEREYNKSTWGYQLNKYGIPKRDLTLKNPNSVFQLLKKHFSRYTPDTVSKITGCPKELFLKVTAVFCATGKPDKSGTIMYAMGTTQHTVGTQNIRSYAILQLLLGNIGVAGGGINALRGLSNVQGSTDHGLLFHLLPGYLKAPTSEDKDLATYLAKYTPLSKDPKSANWWQHTPKYIISLLKAFWGKAATRQNEFCYQYLPKRSANYSWISLFEAMYAGDIKGLLVWGQNSAVCGPNASMERKALEELDWMMVTDLWETETAGFWKRPGVDPTKIKTEVFLLPAASALEKEGSITNSGRWSQWRYKCAHPSDEAKSDLWIMNQLYRRIKALYEKEKGVFAAPILELNWDYGQGDDALHVPDVHRVAREINGYEIDSGRQVSGFTELKSDGTTCSGNWLYCGSYTQEGNMAARRGLTDVKNNIGIYPQWAWCWPANRRILYNRASCNIEGKPWVEDRYVIRWDGTNWTGDVPDGGWPPGQKHPFIMKPEGRARIFGQGLVDGPLPEHYEPYESPVKNLLSKQQNNPCIKIWNTAGGDTYGDLTKYPIIATTFRLTEHFQSGAMSRNLPWLCELIPEMFVEMSKSLAAKKRINNGDLVTVSTARGSITAYALVTDRFRPLNLNGRFYEQVGMPWHFGYCGIATGDSANCLTHHIGDANTMIPEYKAFLCEIRK